MIYLGYDIRWSKRSPMLIEIGAGENKGAVPVALRDLFTSVTVAKQHIDLYVSQKKTKDKDAEAVTEGRSK